MAKRQWIVLGGNTVIDLAQIVKIVFVAGEARLFSVAGEALLLTASSKARDEVATLKEYTALKPGGSWIKIRTDEEDADSLDQRLLLNAVDKLAFVAGKNGTVAELFISGVYAGQVAGELAIDNVRKLLGI